MSYSLNIQTYFERIGYIGPQTATLETLRALHRLHPQVIPFENLNPLLGLPVELDLESLEQKMIHNQRGGYCYEQNLLFKAVLEALGFPVRGLAARVCWNKSDDEITPQQHILLLVKVNGVCYIADVGFGGSSLSAPLLLELDTVQQTHHELYRLVQKGVEYLLQIKINDEWKALYQFNLEEHYLPDYELVSWYLSHHPESHFVNSLKAARTAPGRRYVLSNNTFKIHHLEGETEKKHLETPMEIRETLNHHFRLTLPEAPEINNTLEQLIASEKPV